MTSRMRFVGGPADGEIVGGEEIKSHVTHLSLEMDEKTAAMPVEYYDRVGRDDDGTWVMGWKKEGFDDE